MIFITHYYMRSFSGRQGRETFVYSLLLTLHRYRINIDITGRCKFFRHGREICTRLIISITMQRKQSLSHTIPLPTDERIAELANILAKQLQNEEIRNRYATVRRILTLLGAGAVLSLSLFVTPAAAMLAKPFLDDKRDRDRNAWRQFSLRYLRTTIKRLQKEKIVTVEEKNGEHIIVLTKHGKHRILKYSLETLSIEKPARWDGRWRLVIYDVAKQKKYLRDVFRETLKSIGFYQLQESVWLYPYPCEKEVTFLREYYGIGNEVVYVVATTLEDDSPYITYFGLS